MVIGRAAVPGGCAATILMGMVLYLSVADASAGEQPELSIGAQDGEYRLHITGRIYAPAEYVYAVVTDYRNAAHINPAVTEAEILPSVVAGVVRVRNRTLHRIGPFRLVMDWVGDITELGDGQLAVVTVPELSSFESGRAGWRIVAEGQHTVLDHDSSFRPRFFIPPLLGDYLIKRYVRRNMLETFKRIECRALILQRRERGRETRELEALSSHGRDCTRGREDVEHYVLRERE
jgi:hypothetical protein